MFSILEISSERSTVEVLRIVGSCDMFVLIPNYFVHEWRIVVIRYICSKKLVDRCKKRREALYMCFLVFLIGSITRSSVADSTGSLRPRFASLFAVFGWILKTSHATLRSYRKVLSTKVPCCSLSFLHLKYFHRSSCIARWIHRRRIETTFHDTIL